MIYIDQTAAFDLHYRKLAPTEKELSGALAKIRKVAPRDARITIKQEVAPSGSTYTRIVAHWSAYV